MKTKMGRWFWQVGWLFRRNAVIDVVATSVYFHASPEIVWQQMLLYEEVLVRPPFLLRVLLPYPVRTEGEKTCVGAAVQCTYKGGHLIKRIGVVEPPHVLQFDVVEQHLGIEACITTLGGSYELRSRGGQTEVVLTTNYRGHLRPRSLWRPLERILTHKLHRHILNGMRGSLPRPDSAADSAIEERPRRKGNTPQDLVCTTPQSHSHH
jgi:hypothetical protein